MSDHGDFSVQDKIDILKHAEAMQRGELANRREEETKVFTWSSTILLAIVGALLVAQLSGDFVWGMSGIRTKLVITLMIAMPTAVSVIWQVQQHRYHLKAARVILHIERLLHYFEEGFFDPDGSLFPAEWGNWGHHEAWYEQLVRANGVAATVLFGVLAILMVWIF
jgi:hypothetical protein